MSVSYEFDPVGQRPNLVMSTTVKLNKANKPRDEFYPWVKDLLAGSSEARKRLLKKETF